MKRLRLGIAIPQQVDRLEALLGCPPLDRLRPRVLVDYTDVGRPVFDMFAGCAALREAQGEAITVGAESSSTKRGGGQ